MRVSKKRSAQAERLLPIGEGGLWRQLLWTPVCSLMCTLTLITCRFSLTILDESIYM
jgi:hypothetical protein